MGSSRFLEIYIFCVCIQGFFYSLSWIKGVAEKNRHVTSVSGLRLSG